jgi:hypothetical protein
MMTTVYERTEEILDAIDAGRLDKLTDDELLEWEDAEWSALLALPTEGSRRAWQALNAEIGKRGLTA